MNKAGERLYDVVCRLAQANMLTEDKLFEELNYNIYSKDAYVSSCVNFKIDIPDEIAALNKPQVLHWISAHVVNRYNSQKIPPRRDAGYGISSPYGAYYGRHNLIAAFTKLGQKHSLDTITVGNKRYQALKLKEAAEKAAADADAAAAVASYDCTVVAAAKAAAAAVVAATKAYDAFHTAFEGKNHNLIY